MVAGIPFHLMHIKREANNFYKLYTLNNGQIDSLNQSKCKLQVYIFFCQQKLISN